jgi:putative SOS response-associated peptidase YedK
MPVILADGELRMAWLDPTITEREAIMLCEPFPAERTTVAPANPALNKAGVEAPELLVAPSDSPVQLR